MSIKIITDSASDISYELASEYDIDIMPIVIMKGDETYLDGVDISGKMIYDDMRQGTVYKTGAIAPNEYEEKFKEVLEKYDKAIYVSLSTGMSSTYNNAVLAKNSLGIGDDRLMLVDSRGASMGQGLQALSLAKLNQEGKTFDELKAYAHGFVKNTRYVFFVDSLEYLERGGRVSKLSAAIGKLINMKVVLDVHSDGVIYTEDKVRGTKRAIARTVDFFENEVGHDLYANTIYVCHADCEDLANKVKELLVEKYPDMEIKLNPFAVCIGAHTGPGTVHICTIKNFEL